VICLHCLVVQQENLRAYLPNKAGKKMKSRQPLLKSVFDLASCSDVATFDSMAENIQTKLVSQKAEIKEYINKRLK